MIEKSGANKREQRLQRRDGVEPLVFYTGDKDHDTLADYANRLRKSDVIYCVGTDQMDGLPKIIQGKVPEHATSSWQFNLHKVGVHPLIHLKDGTSQYASVATEEYPTRSVFTQREVASAMKKSQFIRDERPIEEILKDPLDSRELADVLMRKVVERMADESLFQFQAPQLPQPVEIRTAIENASRPCLFEDWDITELAQSNPEFTLSQGTRLTLHVDYLDAQKGLTYSMPAGDIELSDDLETRGTTIRSQNYPRFPETTGQVHMRLASDKLTKLDERLEELREQRKYSSGEQIGVVMKEYNATATKRTKEELRLTRKFVTQHADILREKDVPPERIVGIYLSAAIDLKGQSIPWEGVSLLAKPQSVD